MKKDLMVNYMSRQLHAENTNLIYVVRNETVRNYGRPAYQMRTLYFCPVSFLFFPRLISAVAEWNVWMSTILTHMVWP